MLTVVAALALLLAHLITNAFSALIMIRYPFGIDYGEGIVWQQMRNIMSASGYGPLGVYPAIVYHYPPVFHVTSGLLAKLLGTDELATARTVSWVATFGTAIVIGLTAVRISRRGHERLGSAVAAGLIGMMFLSCEPVAEWAPLMRVDMLACMFTIGGLLLALHAIDRPRLLHAAALCFTLAVYTKQVSIAAPIAAFIGLAAVRPRYAWTLAGITIAQSGLVLLALTGLTHGNFLRHIILYNVNRVSADALLGLVAPLLSHIVYIGLAFAGAILLARRILVLWRMRDCNPFGLAGAVTGLVYFMIKTLMLGMVMKSGSSTNYMIEWLAAVTILSGVLIVPAVEAASACFRDNRQSHARSALLSMTVLAAVTLQAWLLSPVSLSGGQVYAAQRQAERAVTLIRHNTRPVISDDMTLLIRAGRPVQWEPSIAAELGAVGRYDEKSFVRLVRQKRFGLFITEGDRGDRVYDSRYNPAVADAIAAVYPREYRLGRFTIHAPTG